jgi:hypothetical protein
MMTLKEKNPIAIRRIHYWQVWEWKGGKWVKDFLVQTWTRTHSLACRKAKEYCPVLRSSRFKVTHSRVDECSSLEMNLLVRMVAKPGDASWQVADIYGEYDTLAAENKRARKRA